jgi:hypothetical protein
MKKAKLREKIKRVKSERDAWHRTADLLASSIRHSLATDTCTLEIQALKTYDAVCAPQEAISEQ